MKIPVFIWDKNIISEDRYDLIKSYLNSRDIQDYIMIPVHILPRMDLSHDLNGAREAIVSMLEMVNEGWVLLFGSVTRAMRVAINDLRPDKLIIMEWVQGDFRETYGWIDKLIDFIEPLES